MKLDTVLEQAPGWFEAGLSVYLKSPPGIGKSETIGAVPAILSKKLNKNIGFVLINGPLLSPGDAVGYLMPKHMPDGRIESQYSEPFWFRTIDGKHLSEFDGGIIFIDEEDKADTDVKKVIGEAKLSGRLGPHVIPKGWVVWGAGNRSEDRSGSTKELDHLINRRVEVDVTADLEAWTKWAFTHQVTPLTVAFANANPELVLNSKVPAKQGPWCTPRSLVAVDRYIAIRTRQNGGEIPDDPTTIEEVSGMIGGASAQFFAHVKLEQEMPKYEKIVADPTKAKLPSKPDAQMLVCYSLAHRVKAADIGNVITYIERMSPEFSVTFAKAATTRDNSLVMAPAMSKWCQKNASLMAAISEHKRAA